MKYWVVLVDGDWGSLALAVRAETMMAAESVARAEYPKAWGCTPEEAHATHTSSSQIHFSEVGDPVLGGTG